MEWFVNHSAPHQGYFIGLGGGNGPPKVKDPPEFLEHLDSINFENCALDSVITKKSASKKKIKFSKDDDTWLNSQYELGTPWEEMGAKLYEHKKSKLRSDISHSTYLDPFNPSKNKNINYDLFKHFISKNAHKTGKGKGNWTSEEDDLLRQGVEIFGQNFADIAEFILECKELNVIEATSSKTRDQCYQRSLKLSPRAKWTVEDSEKLLRLAKVYEVESSDKIDGKWSLLARHFENFTKSQCKDKFFLLKRKKSQK